MKIRTAVIPIAGKGTRFLPATKEIPKEMIPILNYPMLHYVVTEAVNAGIENIIFITSRGKESIGNFYKRNKELESFLDSAGKKEELELIKKIGELITFKESYQDEQLGLGHAILCAESEVKNNERFAVLLGDDIVLNDLSPVTGQLIDASEKRDNAPVIGVMKVPREETSKYGIVAGIQEGKFLKMTEMIEKPSPESAPTDLATPGRYIFGTEIFKYLKQIERGAGGEYQLTDAINLMCKSENVYAYEFDGDRYDSGNVKAHLNAIFEIGLRSPEYKDYLINLMKEKLEKYE